ncbi:hypothetical protein [Streptomyces buecherae]|uniref:hypothetical protein n=1 Tax=Streptomyces buecherae TaxID=2763006 RepID=UPI001E4E62A0|nr:hypothetical protein [Streptomyces buecherae]
MPWIQDSHRRSLLVEQHESLGTSGAADGAEVPTRGTTEAARRDAGQRDGLSHRDLKVMQFNIWLGGSQVEGGREGIADTVAGRT